MIRKICAALALACVVSCCVVVNSRAWMATEFTQIMNNLQLLGIHMEEAEEIANQVTQLEHEVTMIQQGISNLTKLTENPMAAINSLQQLSDAIQRGQVLSYKASDINGRIDELYPGYASYKDQDLTPEVIDQRYSDWSTQNKDSINAVLSAAGIEDDTITNEEMNMDGLIEKSRNAEGNLQAAQAGNLLAAEEIKSLQRLRKLTADNSQLIANFYAKEQDKEDLDKAKWQQMLGQGDTVVGDGENILSDRY